MTSKELLTSFTPKWIYPAVQKKQLTRVIKMKKRKRKVVKNVVKMRKEVTRILRVGDG